MGMENGIGVWELNIIYGMGTEYCGMGMDLVSCIGRLYSYGFLRYPKITSMLS
jgi:hypothetical protein